MNVILFCSYFFSPPQRKPNVLTLKLHFTHANSHTHTIQVTKKTTIWLRGNFNLGISFSWHFMLMFMPQLGPASVAYSNHQSTYILPVIIVFSVGVVYFLQLHISFNFLVHVHLTYLLMHARKSMWENLCIYMYRNMILSQNGKPIYISQDRHHVWSQSPLTSSLCLNIIMQGY